VSQEVVCREVVELITAYMDDALPADTRAAVAAHLSRCDGCTAVMAEFRRTIELTGMVTEEQLTDHQRTTLLDAFRGWATA
jgi:anti-sigma factor RsiW